MWMELRGEKAAKDFLKLYSRDSTSFQIQDSRAPPHPSRGLFLKTHDFLQPLEKRPAEKDSAREGKPTAPTSPPAAAIDINRPVGPVEHVLPGGIGTYNISHVRAAVKPEKVTCPLPERKREPDDDDDGPYGGVAFVPAPTGSRGHWPGTFAARGSSGLGSHSSSRSRQAPDRKKFMEAFSRSSDDDDDFGKRDDSGLRGDLSGKGDRKGSDPSTPRSKHSATEQRRRSKINDRFQILRDLIPHSDQKRDKASFLLEVIEYVRFLQEKVQKYESSDPGWNQENAWEKVYFRSVWKNARNNSQSPIDSLNDPSQVMKNGTSEFMFPDSVPAAQLPAVSGAQNLAEPQNMPVDVSYKAIESFPLASVHLPPQPNLCVPSGGSGVGVAQLQQRLIPGSETYTSQSQAQAQGNVSTALMNEQEELIIDEGTISLSSIYSEGLLTTLNQALQSSGVDLARASISVEINLGKRASGPRSNTATTSISMKDIDLASGLIKTAGHSGGVSSGEESEQAPKRHKQGAR